MISAGVAVTKLRLCAARLEREPPRSNPRLRESLLDLTLRAQDVLRDA